MLKFNTVFMFEIVLFTRMILRFRFEKVSWRLQGAPEGNGVISYLAFQNDGSDNVSRGPLESKWRLLSKLDL